MKFSTGLQRMFMKMYTKSNLSDLHDQNVSVAFADTIKTCD